MKNVNPNPVLAARLDRISILHADHEQNASTSTVRLAVLPVNPFALYRSRYRRLPVGCFTHGGANEAVLEMLDEIGDVSNVAEYMEGVKQRKYRLMGFGHRVYRNMDPRASIMRETCYEVLKELGLEDSPKFKLAMEQIALKDPFFVERKL